MADTNHALPKRLPTFSKGRPVQWAERIMRRIDGTFASSAEDKRWQRA
jgi:hypothetical protein